MSVRPKKNDMNVYLTRTPAFQSNTLYEVWTELSHFQGPLKFNVFESPIDFNNNYFDFRNFPDSFESYRQAKSLVKDDFLVTISDIPNLDNWFSSLDFNGDSRNIYIYGREWENYIYCNIKYPLAYEVVANILHRLFGDSIGDFQFAHEPPIGCVNDMCMWKPDISFKFRTGDICIDCIQRFRERGIGDDVLRQCLEIFLHLRSKMLYSSSLQPDYKDFDLYLPHNIAITKRKIASTNEPLRKFLFLIDHFDSLVRAAVIYHIVINLNPESTRINYLNRYNLKIRPTLGNWVRAFRGLGADFIGQRVEGQGHQLDSLLGRVTDDLVNIRNTERGHGYISCNDNSYRQIYTESLPSVNLVEEGLMPLFNRYKLCYIKSVGRINTSDFKIELLNFEGSNIIFNEESLTFTPKSLEDIPMNQKVYLRDLVTGRLVSLDPYYKYINCPVCNHPRILIHDGQSYIDPLIGHLVEINLENT